MAQKQQLQQILDLWKADKDFILTELLPEVERSVNQEECLPQVKPQLNKGANRQPKEAETTLEEPQEGTQPEDGDDQPEETHVSWRHSLPNVNTTNGSTLSAYLDGVSAHFKMAIAQLRILSWLAFLRWSSLS